MTGQDLYTAYLMACAHNGSTELTWKYLSEVTKNVWNDLAKVVRPASDYAVDTITAIKEA